MIQVYKPHEIVKIPEVFGVYIYKDAGSSILYIGKAKNLKHRVSSYFRKDVGEKTAQFVPLISSITIIAVQSELEALLLEAKLINTHKPKYNVIWKDDKHYIYIYLTKETFPKILLARKIGERGTYFGPFPSTRTVRELLKYIRTIFPYCTQKRIGKRACFYTHLGLCNPCPNVITQKTGEEYNSLFRAYRANIRKIILLLQGKFASVRKLLERDMTLAAKDERFEEAAELRDRLTKLDYLVTQYQAPEAYIENPTLASMSWRDQQQALATVLAPFYPALSIRTLECYDISNISGTLATGSMVTFRDGTPDTSRYRKFRIRTRSTPDDFAMMAEVLGRRLKHAEWELPDLCIIDGGKPQLAATKKVFVAASIRIPLVGIAKRLEEIVVPLPDGAFKKIRLPHNHPALFLVQRIRDESHRFAHRYHEVLRLKHLIAPFEKKGRI